MIDLSVDDKGRQQAVDQARRQGILIPTFAEMRDPERIRSEIRSELKGIGLWDVHPRNLFRITWKNEPVKHGGGFGGVNYLAFPSELTGVRARVIALVGKWFPTGAHKVGATFGCLVPRLVTGQFDPVAHKAAWPSTGNFCRGGAYNSALLGCDSIAILPEGMSRERFDWLRKLGGEVIATPGSESNVWEIFQKCKELQATRPDVTIFNQFDEPGNHLWHHAVTGPAMEEVLRAELGEGGRYAGVVLTSGSAGTLGCGDYLKEAYPTSVIAVGESLQCPTLLQAGFGSHRIEGIGDKHVPWIHNVRNTDLVIAIHDEAPMRLIRLFNEPEGRKHILRRGVSASLVDRLDLVGISGAANLLMAVKLAHYYELTERDVVLTVLTDSMELYGSRIEELRQERGPYTATHAAVDHERYLLGATTDHMLELSHWDRRRVHNLKYFTWVEQMGKPVDELDAQWYDWPEYWDRIHSQADAIDDLIREFNRLVVRG